MMTELNPTYAFQDDGNVYAILDGQVIASGPDPDEVKDEAEAKIKSDAEKAAEEKATKRKASATHVVTPNGLKGTILNRTSSWDAGDSVSVRFENGSVVTLATSKLPLDSFVTEDNQKVAGTDSPIGKLSSRLETDFEHDRDALVTRRDELKEIQAEARALITKGASYTDAASLDEIVVLAEAEQIEVEQAVDHLDAADQAIFSPFEPQVVEQATVGVKSDGSWLDNTMQDMVNEAEGQDFKTILDEGPTQFVAELPDAAIADQGVTQDAAADFISAKTAGVESDVKDKYTKVFVERVEQARRAEVTARKDVARKEASVEEPAAYDGPDEALFL